jgi:DNA-binding NarL/FixJ family response regulator
LLENLNSVKPDVVLMDIEMPGMNGVEAVKHIKQHMPHITIVMQTVFEDDDKVFDAICGGASGYLLKNTPPSRLMEAIIEAHEGGAPMSPSIAKKTLNLFQKYLSPLSDSKHQDYHLSSREKEVLQWMVCGYSYKMIADVCHISFDTVRTHIRNIYQKLHVACMSEAVAKAIKERLV